MEEGMKLRYNYIKRMVLRLRGRKGTKVPPLEMLLLKELLEGDAFEYQISQFPREYSGESVAIAAGVIYPVLDRMVKKGYEGNFLAGQEVKITFSKSFLNAGIFRKKLSVGQKVSIRYFLSGVNEEEKIITVERMSILE